MSIMKRAALGLATLTASAGVLLQPAAAYPDRPVTIVVAWPAGGATDLMVRAVQDSFTKALGVQTIIKNVAGAAGTIGTTEVSRATPDGYTILVSPIGPMVIQPQRMKLTYDSKSFDPICKTTDSPVLMMSPPESRFKTVKGVVDAAKADAGKLAYASTGPGTIPHMSMLAFAKASGTTLKHVPFKGSADVVQAMLAGTIELLSDQPNLVNQYNLTPIAVMAANRLPGYPNVPTMKQEGYDLEFSIWNGMFAPKGTPEAVLVKLQAACKAAMADPAVVTALDKQRQPIQYMDRAAFGAFVKAEEGRAAELIKDAGLAPK